MTWFGWFLICSWLAGVVFCVTRIGKPIKPLSATAVAVLVVIDAVMTAGVVLVGT